ncbi:siderophore ABC transporter permease CdtC [Acrocarpospora macrocephala]|uniref:Iron-hydroxamate transporter permease subunit n=1 Tax=Acrocarpospora macrocephala TaxID=150177 RepID=A0A5M3WUH3_9ACTN|nr:iron ABC transporter permease [Acrocarpospora macrocephala]GES09778.1 iron-hydroxamate transporter permease subunit [Acrocarpospora macrocephala]
MTAALASAAPMRPVRRFGPPVACAAALALLAVVSLWHLGQGASRLGVGDVVQVLTGGGDQLAGDIVFSGRLPRTLAGLVAGLALGLAGGLVQGGTRNPLAAPDTLGVNAGAYLAVTIVGATGLSVGVFGTGAAALAGAVAAAALVYALAGRSLYAPGRVLLAGTAVALAATSIALMVQMLNEQTARGTFFWGNGSLIQTGLSVPLWTGAAVLVLALAVPALVRPLDLLALGDDTAEAMGVNAGRMRLYVLLLSVAFAAVAVTVAGPIGFVGLVAPIAVRMAGIHRHAWLLPLSAAAGALLVLLADGVGQALQTAAGGEIPVGVVTALVGGPVFLLLVRRLTTGDAETGAAVTETRPVTGRRYATVVTVAAVLLAAGILVGVCVGTLSIDLSQLLNPDPLIQGVLSQRFTRVLAAAGGGACLAVAGGAVQAVIRNPLAEPSLLGVTGGAAIGAVTVITLASTAPRWMIPGAAALGGLLALLLVIAVARRKGVLDPTRVVLVGIGLAAATSAVVQVLALRSTMTIGAVLTWLAGSTYGRAAGDLLWLAVPLVVTVLLVAGTRPLDMLALGEDLPRAFGLRLGRVRLLVLMGAVALAAGTAATIGAVGFVGLIAPHLARSVVGSSHRRMLPVAALLGAVLVVVADTVGRVVIDPRQIPVGVMTALVGTPYMIWLLRSNRRASR